VCSSYGLGEQDERRGGTSAWLGPYTATVMTFRCALIWVVVGFSGVGVRAGFAQGDADPTTLLRVAVDKLDQTKQARNRFTYLDLNHTRNFNEKGKSTADSSHLYEVTYIADLQYSRLLEENGKPLKGKALEEEQRRYDDAIRDRAALDDKARAALQRTMMKSAGVDLSVLPTAFHSTVVSHTTQDGRDCLLVDSTPLPGAPRKHYWVWLDPVAKEVVRIDFDQLADEGDMLRGATGSKAWTYIDGTPLLASSHVDARVLLNDKKTLRVVVDHTHTRFRRFSATSKIVAVEPEDKATPPQ